MYDELTRLAIIHGTDKFGRHDYTPNYFKLFAGLRDRPIKMLEIGVGGFGHLHKGGESLHVWQDFFPNGEITGMDIQKKALEIGPRVEIWQGSQVDPDFLTDLVAARGPFDIILDDGSHRNEHVVGSYELLFPTLKPGGIYVVEDTQTAFRERFGGSLTMEPPNSIGLFADIFRRLNSEASDPLIADVASVERYHNIVVLHKGDGAAGHRRIIETTRLSDAAGPRPDPAHVLSLASDPVIAPWLGRCPGAEVVNYGPHFIDPSVVASHGEAFDLIVCESGPDGAPDPVWFDTLFGCLKTGGNLIVQPGPDGAAALSDGSALMDYLTHRFVEVDHREITHHFPDAPMGAHAREIHSIERFRDGVLIHKAPNDYPSSFDMDMSHPQAQAYRQRIEEVLEADGTEGGLTVLAETLRREGGLDAVRRVIERLNQMGARTNRYFAIAGDLARRDRNLDDAVRIYEEALTVFPFEPEFAVHLAREYVRLGRSDEALHLLEQSRDNQGGSKDVYLSIARIYDQQDRVDDAVTAYSMASRRTPKHLRAPLCTRTAELMIRAGNPAAAIRELLGLMNIDDGHAPAYRLLGQLLWEKGDAEGAREAVERAITLAPDEAEYQAFAAKMAG